MMGIETVPQNSEVIVDKKQFTIELQKYYSGHNENSKKLEWTREKIRSVIKLLDEFNLAKSRGGRLTNTHYYHASKYDVMSVGNQKVLIVKRKEILDPFVQIVPSEEYYEKILDAHIATGHGRRDKIVHALKDAQYMVPIFAITTFINMCKTCFSKKSISNKAAVVKPSVSVDFNRRGQMNFIDFQTSPDEEYKWLLLYQDLFTKFCFLRPLKSETAKEVAIEILKIFLEVGCPSILQSDHGREFTASVLKEIRRLWPACKIVNGRTENPQSQGSIECQDIKKMIWAWMEHNKSTNWSIACYFVQFQKNTSYHSTIAKSPYKALFGKDPELGLSSTHLSKVVIPKSQTEEDMEGVLNEIENDEEQNSEDDQDETVPLIKRVKIEIEIDEQEDLSTGGYQMIPSADIKHEPYDEPEKNAIVNEEIITSSQSNPDLEISRSKYSGSHLRNVILDVSNSDDKNGMPRNAILASPKATLSDDVPEDSLPLRSIVTMPSSSGRQRIKRCRCKKNKNMQCLSNKCNCRKANVSCNSRCHTHSSTCNNT